MARAVSQLQELRHGRVRLALHPLGAGSAPALLHLHALHSSAARLAAPAVDWLGAVFAVDFCGHGRSGWVAGGAYTPELLAGDGDAALARIGPACLAGEGIGAYVALLLAGARPELVPAALLLPGAGLEGGGSLPDFSGRVDPEWAQQASRPISAGAARGESDPLVCALERDARPIDYVEAFAARARHLVLAEDGGLRPAWWEAVARSRSAERVAIGEAWRALKRAAGSEPPPFVPS
jgi:pimeloyl-ACP methyl ester carboxylesterase